MDIHLGMHVYTSDNQDIGAVDKLILDPETGTVTAAVVRKGFLLHDDIEVPADMLTAGPEDTARIDTISTEVDTLPRFHEADYLPPPAEYLSPFGYPAGDVFWPAGYSIGMAGVPLAVPPVVEPAEPVWTGDAAVDQEVDAALSNADLEHVIIDAGSEVLGRDDEKVGTVHELTFDPVTSKLTGLVVHKGLIMGKDIALPVSLIDRVDDGVVYLKVNAGDAVQ
jgi:sporulation protein YlmC with PRC-barrel domain